MFPWRDGVDSRHLQQQQQQPPPLSPAALPPPPPAAHLHSSPLTPALTNSNVSRTAVSQVVLVRGIHTFLRCLVMGGSKANGGGIGERGR